MTDTSACPAGHSNGLGQKFCGECGALLMEIVKSNNSSDELTSLIENSLKVLLISTDFQPRESHPGRVTDFIKFSLAFQNTGTNDIRAFTGTFTFTDFFDNEHLRLTITVDSLVIPTGKQVRDDSWSIDLNRFNDGHNWLKTHSVRDMQVRFETSAIMFTDGSKIFREH